VKLRKGLIVVATFVVLVVLLVVVEGAVQRRLYVSPTPETESVFFKSFTPEQEVINRFECSGEMAYTSSSGGDGAYFGYASHKKDFTQYFAIRTADRMSLTTALQQDLLSQLRSAGGEILDETGDARQGFRAHYRIGKSLGVISVDPVKTGDSATRAAGHSEGCPGAVAVQVHVSVEEKWYKKEPAIEKAELSTASM